MEADFNRKGTSLYSGRVGERVASDLVTIFDDGNLPGERGTVAVDDEGTPGQHKVLVENGILQGYMQDRLNARLMGVDSTGSGRRQSFRVMPQPRMCNTHMPSGTSAPEEIVGSIERGLYAASFSGGQVEISKGDFVFMVAEGYLIEARQDHRAGARRDAGRQRARRDDQGDDGRQRRPAGEPLLHLRQGRAVRARRGRHTDHQAGRVHRRWHRPWLIRATRRWRWPTRRSG